MRRLLFAMSLCAVVVGPALAVQPPPPPGAQPPADPKAKDKEPTATPAATKPEGAPEFEARFVDDSLVKVVPVDSAIVVITKYGKLNVPLADILRLEVGFRYPDGLEVKIDEAIVNLGSGVFKDREEAEKTLFKIGEYSAPALRRATKSTDPEVSRRAETVYKKLVEKYSTEKLDVKDYDLVETSDITIRGRVEAPTIKVKTKQFGEATLRMADLRAIRSTATSGNEFTLEATKYARANDNTWLDTGVDVSTDQALELIATGQVDLGPGQPGQYMSTPIGNGNNGYGPMVMTPNGRQYRYLPGALVGRIGNEGIPFLAGANYKVARPTGTGRLYLKISPSAWGGESNGSYKVKLKVGG